MGLAWLAKDFRGMGTTELLRVLDSMEKEVLDSPNRDVRVEKLNQLRLATVVAVERGLIGWRGVDFSWVQGSQNGREEVE